MARFLLPAWVAAAAMPAWAENASRWPKLEEVIVVSKTHFDIGFTDLASRVVDRYRTSMADQALKLVDESRGLPPDQQFAWTLAGWPMAQVLWPGQTAERRERFVAAMRAGRLVPHALAFTTHTESLDLEDLTRGFRFSVEMARLAGQPLPTGCKMTDVPDHTRGLATVLANAGVKFFHLGCNDNCSPADVPAVVLVGGSGRLARADDVLADLRLGPLPARRLAAQDVAVHVDDRRQPGPAQHQEVEALFARAKRDLPGVRVRFGRMSDFADAIVREKPDLPVVRSDTPDTWIHGIGSMPIETQLAHATRPRIAALESLDTLLGAWGVPTEPVAPIVRDAYENTLLFGEHTWGPDVGRYAGYSYGEEWKKKLAAGEYRFLLEGFDQKRAYAHRAAELVEPAIRKRMAALAKAVDVPGRRIVVFNPLPWTRDGASRSALDRQRPRADRRRQPTRPSRPRRDNGTLRFVARNLPPLGYRTFVPAERTTRGNVSADANAQCIENELLRVTLDPARCGIKSIVDKRTGRELVNTQSPYALGQYLYERFDADQGLRHAHAYVTHRPNQDPGEIGCQSKPKSALGQGASLLRGDGGGRDLVEIYSNEARPLPAQGGPARHHSRRHATPRHALRRRALAGPGVVDRQQDARSLARGRLALLPAPRREPHVPPGSTGQHRGPGQGPGAQLEPRRLLPQRRADGRGRRRKPHGNLPHRRPAGQPGAAGLWHYSRDFVAHKPDVFVMLFNNVYSTNFAQWIEGSWSSRVRLWPIDGASRLRRRSSATRGRPASHAWRPYRDAAPGKLPPQATGLAVEKLASLRSRSRVTAGPSSRGPLVTAFGPNPYGEGTLLRFWEQAGDGGAFAVHLPRGMNVGTAQPCDLRGQPTGSPITVSERRFQREDPVHGPGKFHPPDADAGVAALSRALDDFLEACISMAVLDRRARNRNPKRKRG